jgi:NAD(P)H dehydrogenase (quinone)
MILITGASGKTGKAILRQLRQREPLANARALVHRSEQIDACFEAGAAEVLASDLEDQDALAQAFDGVECVYHITPNMYPDEYQLSRTMIDLAASSGVKRYVYHSVLHPQVQSMPHHWSKLRVEEYLINRGLPFTILQPCAYMQNVLGYWEAIQQEGVYEVPYGVDTCISVVDLEDVAEAAARVLTEDCHERAIYELAGPQALSQTESADLLAEVLGRPVAARELDRGEWERHALEVGMNPYAVKTLLAMFMYYDECGFIGSPNVLAWLLGRPPRTYSDFLQRVLAGG